MEASLAAMLAAPPVPASHRLTYGDSPHQLVDLYLPESSRAGRHRLILAIHGGYWRAQYDLGHLSHACAALAAEGFAVASLEYRRIGHDGGGYPGTLHDVARAAELVRQNADRFGLDPSHVVALGHSAGGQLALWLGAQRAGDDLSGIEPMQIAGIVGLAPVSNLVRGHALGLGDGVIETFLGGTPDTQARAYLEASPASRLPLGIRQRIVHGDLDDVVPIELSRDYVHDAARLGDAVTLVELPGADHYCLVNPRSREWPTVVMQIRESFS